MTISAILLIALASTVSLMLRASERVAQSGQNIEDVSRLLASLSGEIQQIRPHRWAGKNAGFVFAGDVRNLIFARAISLADGTGESDVVTFRSIDGTLVRAHAPLLPHHQNLSDLALQDREEMSNGQLAVRFAYVGRTETGQEMIVDEWSRSDLMPVAVRISLTDSDGRLRGWARAPILVDAEPGCVAPGQAVCSLAPLDSSSAEKQIADDAPIDPDDALGWMRYAQ